jgi:hypothetical protein
VSLQYWKPEDRRFFRLPYRAASFVFLNGNAIQDIYHVTGRHGILYHKANFEPKGMSAIWKARKADGSSANYMLEYQQINEILAKCLRSEVLIIAADSFEEHEDFITDCLGSTKLSQTAQVLLDDAEWSSTKGISTLLEPIRSSSECQIFDKLDTFRLRYLEALPRKGVLISENGVIKYAHTGLDMQTSIPTEMTELLVGQGLNAVNLYQPTIPREHWFGQIREKIYALIPMEKWEQLTTIKDKTPTYQEVGLPFPLTTWMMILSTLRANHGLSPESPYFSKVIPTFDPFDL